MVIQVGLVSAKNVYNNSDDELPKWCKYFMVVATGLKIITDSYIYFLLLRGLIYVNK